MGKFFEAPARAILGQPLCTIVLGLWVAAVMMVDATQPALAGFSVYFVAHLTTWLITAVWVVQFLTRLQLGTGGSYRLSLWVRNSVGGALAYMILVILAALGLSFALTVILIGEFLMPDSATEAHRFSLVMASIITIGFLVDFVIDLKRDSSRKST